MLTAKTVVLHCFPCYRVNKKRLISRRGEQLRTMANKAGSVPPSDPYAITACHKIPTVANFWIDFGKGHKILLLFLRRTQLHFSQGASEKSHQKDLLKQLNK